MVVLALTGHIAIATITAIVAVMTVATIPGRQRQNQYSVQPPFFSQDEYRFIGSGSRISWWASAVSDRKAVLNKAVATTSIDRAKMPWGKVGKKRGMWFVDGKMENEVEKSPKSYALKVATLASSNIMVVSRNAVQISLATLIRFDRTLRVFRNVYAPISTVQTPQLRHISLRTEQTTSKFIDHCRLSLPEDVNEGRRYLKGCEEATKSQVTDEDRAITSPQFGQLSALLKRPKFSNLPLIKQLNKVRLHLGEKAGMAYLARRCKTSSEFEHPEYIYYGKMAALPAYYTALIFWGCPTSKLVSQD
ncbi:hypothetical protein GQ600_12292 [Phytophthora cactorum]|nr:hypothetical protein GQ600_12292 [Phytophthora cactorum]